MMMGRGRVVVARRGEPMMREAVMWLSNSLWPRELNGERELR